MKCYPGKPDVVKLDVINKNYVTLVSKKINYETNNKLRKIINYDYFCHFTINDTTIVGFEPKSILNTDNEPSEEIRNNLFDKKFYKFQEIEYPIFLGGYLGYYGYENISDIEPTVEINDNNPTGIPINILCLYDKFIEINNKTNIARLCAICNLNGNISDNYDNTIKMINELETFLKIEQEILWKRQLSSVAISDKWQTNSDKINFIKVVKKLKNRIHKGDFIQVVPSRKMYKYTSSHPYDIFDELSEIGKTCPYRFILKFSDFFVIGASPELLVKINNGKVSTCPIAGTRPRGATEEEDLINEQDLITDKKEVSEHIMLVDLARNDIGKISKPGTITIDEYKEVKYFSNVMHICSKVTGHIKEDYDCLDALRAIFPAGTLSGAPKICAMQNITEVETERRNFYGGGIGFINYDKTLDMCIGIRTVLYKNSTVYLQAGGGIVYDSNPKSEFYETMHKMNSVKKAIMNAELTYLKKDIKPNTRVLLIDNYCSFTYNIFQYLSEMVDNIDVIRNDSIDISKILDYTHIILGPGPKSPKDTDGFKEILDTCKGRVPILGICLGHECIYDYFGGTIKVCREIMHGKSSDMTHNNNKLFNNITNPFSAMRYHSLVCDPDTLPNVLEIISTTSNNIIMGIKHKEHDIYGIQFHPESIETNFGKELLKNFLVI